MDNPASIQRPVNEPDSTDITLGTPPDSDIPVSHVNNGTPIAHPAGGSFFSMDGLFVSCIIPPLMGFGFVALGFCVIYGRTTLVVSPSTEHAVLISQAFTALFSVWHFLALIPVLSMIQRVRSEEWWRRLLKTNTFNRINSVSSNISGVFGHTVEMVIARSSPYFKSAWIATIIAVVLADISPGAIRIAIGTNFVPASFAVPALLPNSIYGNYSTPFSSTDPNEHDSVQLGPVYFDALMSNTYVKGPTTTNMLVPRPNVSPGIGYRYSTDVAFMNYTCSWHAPELAEPDSLTDINWYARVSIKAGNIQGLGFAPLAANDVYPMTEYTHPSSSQPSFDGNVAFVMTSGSPFPGQGYINLSSVPTSGLSANWQKASAAWLNSYFSESPFTPVESMSVVVCSPKYAIEPWIVEFINGSVTLVQRQSRSVGNLDPRQLNISIQDCFGLLPRNPPSIAGYGLSGVSIDMFMLLGLNTSVSDLMTFTPIPEFINRSINIAIPTFVQAYLDNLPFGGSVPPGSELLTPALVLSADLIFIYVITALYAVLSGILFYLFTRPAAEQFTIRSVLRITQNAAPPHTTDVSGGQDVTTKIEQISVAGSDTDDSATATRINKLMGYCPMSVRQDLTTHHLLLKVDSQQPPVPQNPPLERYENMQAGRSRIAWAYTPVLGALLVGFGVTTWRHPYVISLLPLDRKAAFFSALFTWGLGIWRSVSLFAIAYLIRQANSDEWSRLLKRYDRNTMNSKLRGLLNEISTNTLSFLDGFRAALLTKTTMVFKVCYVSALITSLCAVVAQGAVTLLVLPSMNNQVLNIPNASITNPINVPWTAAGTTQDPANFYLIGSALAGTSWTHLEHVAGTTIGDSSQPGYVIPRISSTNNSFGIQYATDVAHIQCECNWVAPTFPPPPTVSNGSIDMSTMVSLESFGIEAVQYVPVGVSTFAPLDNMTFTNSTPVTSGLFAWTLWGGGPKDPVNLASVPSTNLSADWQQQIAEIFQPTYLQLMPDNGLYITNITRATVLVCDPHIEFMPKTARAFGGFVELSNVSAAYRAGVGNMDANFMSYMVYNYAAQQALSTIGTFRPYLVFSEATGNAIFASDPVNPDSGIVPKSTEEIANALNGYIVTASKIWTTPSLAQSIAQQMMPINAQYIQQSLLLTAALPQVVVTGALYLILGLAALLVTFHPPEAPFTLAGILMKRSKLMDYNLFSGGDGRDTEIDDKPFGQNEQDRAS